MAGADYHLHLLQIASSILERTGIRRFKADFVLEGGAIHTDGEG